MNPVAQIYEYLRARSLRESETWKPASEIRFRPSEIGGCAREIYYRLAGNKPNDFSPETRLLFADGDLHHDAVRRLMLEAGVELSDLIFTETTITETGSARRTIDVEFADKVYPVLLSGRTDGSIKFGDTIVLLELKSIGKNKYDNFQRVFAKGGPNALLKILRADTKDKDSKRQAKHANRRFWYQFQTTLLVTNQPAVYVVFKNRDTGQIGLVGDDGVRAGLLVEADAAVQSTILKRCAMILRALERQQPPSAEFMDGSMSCNMCNFYHLCWGANKEKDNAEIS